MLATEQSHAEDGLRGDASLAFAHAAIASMLRLGIKPTPEHYLVWYRFHSDGDSPLRAALDRRLSEPAALADADMRSIHETFFGQTSEMAILADLSDRLGITLRDAAGIMSGAVSDATAYGRSLESFTSTVERAAGRVPPLVRHLADETRVLRERGTQMAKELSETAGRVDVLRRELDQARQEALTDSLTGLRNRRGFDLALATLFRVQGPSDALTVLALDLDHFKSVNDRFGHNAGDAVLRQLGSILRAASGAGDVVARLGGEEFAMVLPGRPLATARALAERIRLATGHATFDSGLPDQTFQVSLSIGVAQRRPAENEASLLARADAALYGAKRAGRDQVMADEAA